MTQYKMTVKDLIEVLNTLPKNAQFLVGCDEELNALYTKWQIGELSPNQFCIYGLSGTDLEENE